MLKFSKFASLVLVTLVTAALLVGVTYTLAHVDATTTDENYSILVDGADAPVAGRAAPYGQFIVTHNSQSITETQRLGTVARTNGYDPLKALMCDTGTYHLTATLYARTTSTGSIYTLTEQIIFPAGRPSVFTVTQIAPWMSLGLQSVPAGSTSTCGIYVQTP